MPALSQYLALVRCLGPGWLLFRVGYAWRQWSGALRRATPAVSWDSLPAVALRLAPPPPRSAYNASAWGAAAVAESATIRSGAFALFSRSPENLGMPPRWWSNSLASGGGGIDRHWTRSGDLASSDLKGLWELSRFSWAFALARAHVRTSDPVHAAAFWALFADWCEHNPPNWGPQWMCGQEATFRLMAVIFAAEAMGVPEPRFVGLARFALATGRRIAANIDYALSQKNNHGVSECVGLITAALLLPEHPESKLWLTRGLEELRAQLDELVYPDGSFSQHSLVYHRVVLHDLAWCARRLRVARQPVPDWLMVAGCLALDFLLQITDPRTGRAPLFGSNDGANVLSVADGDFLDLRPVVQMCSAVFRGELPMPPGPWDEAAWWMAESWPDLPRTLWPQPPAFTHAPDGGYMQLCSGEGRLFLRCPTRFRHRPGQADMLHIDVWHQGEAFAMDGGSFAYNSAERFMALAFAAQHNVLSVDNIEPMQKFSRFLYLPWPTGTVAETDGGYVAAHDGYAGIGVAWTRWVSPRAGGGFIVRDRIVGGGGRRLRWHWRLADRSWVLGAGELAIQPGAALALRWHLPISATARLLRADPATAYGWTSTHYGAVEPACSLVIEAIGQANIEAEFEFILPS